MNPEAVETILAAAVREYEHELDRFRQTEQKTFAVLAFAGAGIALTVASGLHFLQDVNSWEYALWPVLLLCAVGIVSMVIGAAVLLRVLLSAPCERLKVGDCLTYDEMRKPSEEVSSRLAATYEAALDSHTKMNDRKLRLFDRGTRWVRAGFGAMILCVVIASVMEAQGVIEVRHHTDIREVGSMSRDNAPRRAVPASKPTASAKPAAKPRPYRTDVVRKKTEPTAIKGRK